MTLSSIGQTRLIVLAALLGVNAVLGYVFAMHILPKEEQLSRELQSLTSRVSQRYSEADKLRKDFELIEERKASFKSLQDIGLFNDQNRLVFRRLLADIQQMSGIVSASYEISPGEVISNSTAEKADHAVLQSEIRFEVSAMEDISIYEFMFWLQNGFPGHAMVETVEVVRSEEVDDEMIRKISRTGPEPIVDAKISVTWRTLVSKDDLAEENAQLQGRY